LLGVVVAVACVAGGVRTFRRPAIRPGEQSVSII